MRLLKNNPPRQGGATVAQVSFSDNGGFGALASSEARGVPVFAPRGVAYRPCEGDRLLLLLVDGVETCVGCLSTASDIESGELKLTSSGGATVWLKKNGEISLNGLTITQNGRLIEAGGV